MPEQSVFAYIASSAVYALRSFGWFWIVPAAFLSAGFLFRAISGTSIGSKVQGLGGVSKRLIGCGAVLVALPVSLAAGAIMLALLAWLLGFREG
jgi:hypothetical protein